MINIKDNKEFFDKHPDILEHTKNMDTLTKYVQKDIDDNIVEYWESINGIMTDVTIKMQKIQKAEQIKRELELLKRREAYNKRFKKEADNEN